MPINYNTQLQGSNPYISDVGNSLSSNATTGNVSEGTWAQRREAKGKKPVNGMAIAGAGLAVGSMALDALDKDPGYDNADVLKSATKYASIGSAAGPWGLAAGFAVGSVIGVVEKGKYNEEQKEIREDEIQAVATESVVNDRAQEDQAFNQGQSGAKSGAYGFGDVDNFITKYSNS